MLQSAPSKPQEEMRPIPQGPQKENSMTGTAHTRREKTGGYGPWNLT